MVFPKSGFLKQALIRVNEKVTVINYTNAFNNLRVFPVATMLGADHQSPMPTLCAMRAVYDAWFIS
jgi:hypothetical protein